MNTMKNFDITKLQYYFDHMISFRSADILKWCRTNLDNLDFDIQYAANDIYNHYFSNNDKKPSMRAFYYIQNNSNFSNTMYKLTRDPVMSPTGDQLSKGKYSNYLKTLIVDTNQLYKTLNLFQTNNLMIQTDIDTLSSIEDLFHRRLYTIIDVVEVDLKEYYKYTQYQKSQIYSIHKNHIEDLKTLIFMIQCCEKKAL